MKILKKNNLEILICFLIILLGIYLCLISGYGSDEDTLPMIGVFQGILKNGIIMSSRFTGYPVAELGIGFLAHYFGSWATNIFTFAFFIIGVTFFYLSIDTKSFNKNFFSFLLLCLTSPVLFFDNLEPIDYSWAFLFFALGLFFLKKNFFEIAVLSFGLCIGTRINFTPFILFVILFFNYSLQIKFKRKIIIFLCSFIIGGLFYLTIWYQNSFGLEWLSSARPTSQGLFGLISRFTYKTIFAIGPLFLIFLTILSIIKIKKIPKFENSLMLYLIILINLGIFFYIPAELSYLQPMLICIYFIINKYFSKNMIYLFILLNLFTWLIDFDFLKIKYKDNNSCDNIEAVSATFEFQIKEGKFKQFLNSRNNIIECWAINPDRKKIIKEGGALKDIK